MDKYSQQADATANVYIVLFVIVGVLVSEAGGFSFNTFQG